MELDVISPADFEPYITERFESTGRKIAPEAISAVLDITRGHPYATQELCYFLWELTPGGRRASAELVDAAIEAVLRSEHAHFSLVWERASAAQRLVLQALAAEQGRPLSADYRRRHGLPGASSVQRALEALSRNELVGRRDREYRVVEPFLAEWLLSQL
jgi:uncharacterized protein